MGLSRVKSGTKFFYGNESSRSALSVVPIAVPIARKTGVKRLIFILIRTNNASEQVDYSLR